VHLAIPSQPPADDVAVQAPAILHARRRQRRLSRVGTSGGDFD